jgi:SAM-dependent methyltransferase
MSQAGDFDYERSGSDYARHRRADPVIATLVRQALGDTSTLVNVGAGAGSYEPDDLQVTAVEPSATMRSLRAPDRPAIDAVAEHLPFDDDSFDAAMASVTVHQWLDQDAGLRELRRVARGRVVILTFDPDALEGFWLSRYAPELIAAERARYPTIAHISDVLGEDVSVSDVSIPHDCADGFTEAFYARPEAFLVDDVRRSQSAWGFVDAEVEAKSIARLGEDLASGEWDRRYGELRAQAFYVGSLRLIVSKKA